MSTHEATTSIDPIAEALDRLESGNGPARILVDCHGRCVSPTELGEAWQLHCHGVLVRNDGWTLGCSRTLYEAAKDLFPRRWVGVIAYANTHHRAVVKFPSR
jgi:hypothetical protein